MAPTAAAVILKQETLTISSIGITIIPTLLNYSVAMALTAAAVILKQGKKKCVQCGNGADSRGGDFEAKDPAGGQSGYHSSFRLWLRSAVRGTEKLTILES